MSTGQVTTTENNFNCSYILARINIPFFPFNSMSLSRLCRQICNDYENGMKSLKERECKAKVIIFSALIMWAFWLYGWGRRNRRILEMVWPILTFFFFHPLTFTDEEMENQNSLMVLLLIFSKAQNIGIWLRDGAFFDH